MRIRVIYFNGETKVIKIDRNIVRTIAYLYMQDEVKRIDMV